MQRHNSMRGWFAYELYRQMKKNKNIILLVGDLGYGVWDAVRDEMPRQFINTGAAECALLDIACGMALSGKIPVVYSISSFLLFRPFECIRTYIAKEKIKVLLIGSGRDKDYEHDGWSHDASDVKPLMDLFPSIEQYWPLTKEEIPVIVNKMLESNSPSFLSLKR